MIILVTYIPFHLILTFRDPLSFRFLILFGTFPLIHVALYLVNKF